MSEVLTPGSEAEIAEIVKAAHAASSALEIVGGGTALGLGGPVDAARQLSMVGHSGITLYEPGALTLVAKAGTALAEVEAVLAAEGQRLPFEPMDHRSLLGSSGTPTIGGTVARNNSGPRRIQAGACRDSLIGVRFVNGSGEVIKNGGRVMKNVTGLDLVKLLCGSFGTLGVLTEVSFKVLPVNAREASLGLKGLSVAEAVEVLSRALGSPFEVTGAAYLQEYEGDSLTALRLEGFAGQVDYKLKMLREMLGEGVFVEGDAHGALWQRVRVVEDFAGSDALVWKISAKPSDAPELVGRLQAMGAQVLLDWGGGLIWAATEGASPDAVRAAVSEAGHATLVRAPADIRALGVMPSQPPRLAQLSEALRRKFDPAGVLNPGRMTS